MPSFLFHSFNYFEEDFEKLAKKDVNAYLLPSSSSFDILDPYSRCNEYFGYGGRNIIKVQKVSNFTWFTYW